LASQPHNRGMNDMIHDPHAIDSPATVLLEDIERCRDLTRPKQVLAGFRLAIGSVRYLMKTPALWPSAAVPAVITTTFFMVCAGSLLYFSGDIFGWIWTKPDSWLVAFWWIGRILMTILSVGFGYILAIVFGAIASGPFNDLLSQRVERRIKGRTELLPDDMKANIQGVIRGGLQSIGNLVALVFIMVPILFLNLIPGVGSIAASVLGLLVSSHFLAFEFMDWSLERRHYGWRDKWNRVFAERPLALGFGLGASLLLWIPIVNFAAMPVAVIGGTVLALELDARRAGTESATELDGPENSI